MPEFGVKASQVGGVLNVPACWAAQVQLCSQVAMVENGAVTQVIDGVAAAAAGALPLLRRACPPACVAGRPVQLKLEASWLPPDAQVLCRSRGDLMLVWFCQGFTVSRLATGQAVGRLRSLSLPLTISKFVR